MSSEEPAWVNMQKKTFTNWVNAQLRKKDTQINDILTDFADGIQLINLYNAISPEQIPMNKVNKNPKMQVQKIANLNIVMNEINKFVESVGIKIKYSAEEILNGELKLILGMIWVLISKFAIQDISEEELSAKEALLLWCQKQTKGYRDVNVKDFGNSWRDGLAFCALIHRHHPEYIDYDSLSKENAKENLELAFKIAEEKLDIPALMDAQDMVDTKPDEKSVMTYLSYYWKKFSAGKKGQQAGKKVGKLIDRVQNNDQLINSYETRARDLIAWIQASQDKFRAQEFGNSLAQVQEKFREFSAYKAIDKPAKTEEKLDLESSYSSLRTKQKSEGLPVYTPPEEASSKHIDSMWDDLSAIEKEYDRGIRAELAHMKRMQNSLERFRTRVQKLVNWCTEKEQYLTSENPSSYDSIAAVEARQKILQAYEDEYTAMQASFTETRNIGQQIMDERHAESDQVASAIDSLNSWSSKLIDLAQNLRQRFQEALEHLRVIDQKCHEFAKLAEEFNLWSEEAVSSLTDPISAASVSDVVALESSLQNLQDEYDDKQNVINMLRALSNDISSVLSVNPYSRFTMDALLNKYDAVKSHLDTRRKELSDEKSKQQQNEDALHEYSNRTDEFTKFIENAKAQLESLEESASLENQLASLSAKGKEIISQSAELFAKLADANKVLEDADIVELAPISIQEVSIFNDQLEKYISKKMQVLEQQIFAMKSSNIVSQEQLVEFHETFKFFDKNKKGHLTALQFKSCLESLGEVVSDEEFNKIFASLDRDQDGSVSFDEFVEFMSERAKEGQVNSTEVLDAFRTIANGKDTVTESEIRSAMDNEHATYLLSKMPQTAEGYDYNAYVRETFGNASA